MRNILCTLLLFASFASFAQTNPQPVTPPTPSAPSEMPKVNRFTYYLHTNDNKTVLLQDSISKAAFGKTEFSHISVMNALGDQFTLTSLTYVFAPVVGNPTARNVDNPQATLVPFIKADVASAAEGDKFVFDSIVAKKGESVLKIQPLVIKIVR